MMVSNYIGIMTSARVCVISFPASAIHTYFESLGKGTRPFLLGLMEVRPTERFNVSGYIPMSYIPRYVFDACDHQH